jgi:heme/copper-type cytochrome/quinol oxidase subunit 2
MEFIFLYTIGTIIGLAVILSVTAINNIKKKEFRQKEYQPKRIQPKEHKPINKWIFAIPVAIYFIISFFDKNTERLLAETNKPVNNINIQESQNVQPDQAPAVGINQVITRAPTIEEEKTYMEKNNLIKLGDGYHWCGIKESKEILPVTKALDIGCQNDFCRIQKYYDYVKQIPYQVGTHGKDKNAVDVMQEWKGDCDERSDLLASMMIANGYKVILLYTNSHTLTALNIPNYESYDNRSYVQYQGRKYYIAETTDPNGQVGAYNKDVMHNIKYVYNVNEKKVALENEVNIQLYE